jgi:hypothetical protein
MGSYKAYNFFLKSNILLPALPLVEGQEPFWHFQFLQSSPKTDWHEVWFDQKLSDDNSPWLSIGKQFNSYFLRFPELANFEIDLSARRISCFADPETTLNTIYHLLLDQVIPRLVSHLGGIVIHAGAVVVSGKAIAFLGESGRGKSTLTASFCQQGFPLMSDDGLLLEIDREQIRAFPSYPSLRLWSDSTAIFAQANLELGQVAHYTDKQQLNLLDNELAFSEEPVPLHCVYLLDDPNETEVSNMIHIKQISSRESAIEIIKAAFVLDITDKPHLQRDFLMFTDIAQQVAFYRLTYPRDLAALPDVHQAILQHIAIS